MDGTPRIKAMVEVTISRMRILNGMILIMMDTEIILFLLIRGMLVLTPMELVTKIDLDALMEIATVTLTKEMSSKMIIHNGLIPIMMESAITIILASITRYTNSPNCVMTRLAMHSQ